ncbi:MAG: ATP-binding protein [Planctomycetota bacterium]
MLPPSAATADGLLGPFGLAATRVLAEDGAASAWANAGWTIAALLATAWIATALLRARSLRRIRGILQEDDGDLRDDEDFPLAGPLGSATVRRLRAERGRRARLEERLAEIDRILRATPIAVVALDHMQRVTSVNPAAERLLGIEERAVRRRLLQEVLRQPELNRFVGQALAGDGRATGELHLDLDGRVEVQVSCEPLHVDAHPPGLVVSLVDVTRMRRLESMRSEFAANVSHELRTPITNIKGYVETLLQVGVDDPAQLRRFLEIVHRNTLRLSGIVEDILALAYLEEPEARHALERAPVPARAIAEQVIEDLGSAATARSVRVALRVDCDPWVIANRSLAEQALANLVSNAIRYTEEGTEVTIEIRAERTDMVDFTVSDAGPGIAARHLPRIFERFYRVDKARARTQGGTGLGLAIVKHIAAIHGGRVDVASQVGRGSRFSLTLPRTPTPL